MWFIGTAQPHLARADGPADRTSFLTVDEKRAWADRVASWDTGFVPLCIDHAGGEQAGAPGADRGQFVVPGKLQIGRLWGAGVSPTKGLLTMGEIFWDRPEARAIADSIERKEHWGLSLCTNLRHDAAGARVLAKDVTHVGVTRDPEFAPEGAIIHRAYRSWQGAVDDLVHGYMARQPDLYIPDALRARLVERARSAPQQITAAAASTAVQVAASARVPLLPEARAAPPGASSQSPPLIRSMSSDAPATVSPVDSTPAPATVTATPTPAPTADFADVNKFMDSLLPAELLAKGAEAYSPEGMKAAAALLQKYNDVLQRSGLATALTRWPSDVLKRVTALADYVEGGKRFMLKHQAATNPSGGLFAEAVRGAVEKFDEKEGFYGVAEQLMASASHELRNQRAFEAQLMAKQAELQAAQEKHENELKRTREQFETEKAKIAAELQDKLAHMEKRLRTDAPPTAATSTTTAAPVAVDVAASRSVGSSSSGSGTTKAMTPGLAMSHLGYHWDFPEKTRGLYNIDSLDPADARRKQYEAIMSAMERTVAHS